MTAAAIQALIDAARTGPSDLVTWAELKAILEGLKNQDGVLTFNSRGGTVIPTEGDYSLTQLSDVTLSSPTNTQILQYNGTNWVNAAAPAAVVSTVFGRTGAVTAAEGDYSLTQLSDVTITSPALNQFLVYNGTIWTNTTVSTTTIYNGNGTLSSNRTVDLSTNYSLTFVQNSLTKFQITTTGGLVIGDSLTFNDTCNIITNTTTGTKIGTATNQKIGFFNAAPIVQPANTVAINDVLVNLGLRASGGTSNFTTNIDLSTKDIVTDTTTGTKIATSTSQKIGFFNATPIVQLTTGVGSATISFNTGTNINASTTFSGYTVAQIVQGLRNLGLFA